MLNKKEPEKCIGIGAPSPQKQQRLIIVNADDGFYSEPRDAGIVRGLECGAVSDVSVMMNGIVARQLTARAPSSRGGHSSLYDYFMATHLIPGIHINLTEGLPLDIRALSLVDESGQMLGKFGLQERAIQTKDIDLAEVEREIELQIQSFQSLFQSSPTHADGHQHCHVLPGVSTVFVDCLFRCGIGWTRVPDEEMPVALLVQPHMHFYLTVVHFSRMLPSFLHERSIRYPRFVGLSVMGFRLTAANVASALTEILQEQQQQVPVSSDSASTDIIVELMVHPGFLTELEGGCGSGPDDFSRSPDRVFELEMLESAAFRSMLQSSGWTAVSFSQLISDPAIQHSILTPL